MTAALAHREVAAAALVGLGADERSMTRVAIPGVKDTLAKLESGTCRDAVEAAVFEGRDGAEVRAPLRERISSGVGAAAR